MTLDDFIEGSVDTLQGIGRGIISAPTELVETITNINTMGTEQANSIIDRSVTTRNNVLENDGKPPMSPEEEAEFRERLELQLGFGGIRIADDRVDYDVDDVIEGVNEVAPVLNLPKILEKPETTIGNLSEGFSQFITGYVMLGGGGNFKSLNHRCCSRFFYVRPI